MSLFDLFIKGGVVMYPLLLCLITVVYVAIERMLLFSKSQVDVGQFMTQVRSIFQNGDIGAVLSFSSKDVPVARIVRRGLVGSPGTELEFAL